MPTPWLSCPARLASTRWSATHSASAGALPPAARRFRVKARSFWWSIFMGGKPLPPMRGRQASGPAQILSSALRRRHAMALLLHSCAHRRGSGAADQGGRARRQHAEREEQIGEGEEAVELGLAEAAAG